MYLSSNDVKLAARLSLSEALFESTLSATMNRERTCGNNDAVPSSRLTVIPTEGVLLAISLNFYIIKQFLFELKVFLWLKVTLDDILYWVLALNSNSVKGILRFLTNRIRHHVSGKPRRLPADT